MRVVGLLLLCLTALVSKGQQWVHPVPQCQMAPQIVEASGLEQLSNGYYVTHNDGMVEPELYVFDTLCQLVRTIYLDSVSNIDIEDITVDDSGNVYIGDFGNNNTWHSRTDLQIFKIPDPIDLAQDTIVPQIIEFSYSDQTSFSLPLDSLIYDCESMIHYDDTLYLFSKSESFATSKMTRMYALPDVPGVHVAELKDSLETGGRIGAADLNNSKNKNHSLRR